MITKAELEKMVDSEAEKYAEEKLPPVLQTEYHLIQHENSFKSGASFVSGILMAEIERLSTMLSQAESGSVLMNSFIKMGDMCDEIQSLKDENKKFREALEEIEFQSCEAFTHKTIASNALSGKINA